MTDFTAKDMADFKRAYAALLQFFEPLRKHYDAYDTQWTTDKGRNDVNYARMQSSGLQTFVTDDPVALLGRVKSLFQAYLEDDKAGYLPGVMSDDATALYAMMQHDNAAVMLKGCVLTYLILNAAYFAGQPQGKAGVRPALAENLRLACYFSEVSSGVEPAAAIEHCYPKDRVRIAELPFSDSIDESLSKVLARITNQSQHIQPDAPEGYEWKRIEQKPHLRVLLKIG